MDRKEKAYAELQAMASLKSVFRQTQLIYIMRIKSLKDKEHYVFLVGDYNAEIMNISPLISLAFYIPMTRSDSLVKALILGPGGFSRVHELLQRLGRIYYPDCPDIFVNNYVIVD